MRVGGWLPWRRYLAVWVPAMLFAAANLVGYVLLGGSAGGRAASLRGDVKQLEADCAQLRRLEGAVKRERQQLEALREGLNHVSEETGSIHLRRRGGQEKRLDTVRHHLHRDRHLQADRGGLAEPPIQQGISHRGPTALGG